MQSCMFEFHTAPFQHAYGNEPSHSAIAQILFVSITLSLKICMNSVGKNILVISIGARYNFFFGGCDINKSPTCVLT